MVHLHRPPDPTREAIVLKQSRGIMGLADRRERVRYVESPTCDDPKAAEGLVVKCGAKVLADAR